MGSARYSLHLIDSCLSRLPLCPRLGAGTCLFQETKHSEDSRSVLEELGEGSGAAASKEMLAARGGVPGALQKDMCHRFE